MRFDIITIFPNLCEGYLSDSILKKAIENELLEVHFHNPRDYTEDKHKKVDDTPYGGGAGMVMTPQPLFDCINKVKESNDGPVIYMSPTGKELVQKKVQNLSKNESLIILCGRYEGIDQRVIDLLVDEEVSIGQYVLTGGELPALIMIDSIARLIPGVLGDEQSHQTDSFSDYLDGKKQHPVYTKPEVFEELEVPEVLRSGHHKNIEDWKQENTK
jgi:tRNA (guanine37-N1)-methyltransferase